MKVFGAAAASLAALFIGSANAESVAYLTNQLGGRIVFTNETCYDRVNKKIYEPLLQMYSYSHEGDTLRGCYYYEKSSNLLHVTWEDTRENSVFDASSLKFFH